MLGPFFCLKFVRHIIRHIFSSILNPFANVYKNPNGFVAVTVKLTAPVGDIVKSQTVTAANEILGVVAFLGGLGCSFIVMITEGDQIKARSVFGSSYKSPCAVVNIIEIMKTDGIQGVERGAELR